MFQITDTCSCSVSTSSCPCARHGGSSSSNFFGLQGYEPLHVCVHLCTPVCVCVFTLAILLAYQGSLLLTLSNVTVQCEPQTLPDLAYSF